MAKKTKTQPATIVTFLLDKSGSMGSIRDSTIAAYNAYLGGLTGAGITISLLQFDSYALEKTYTHVDAAKAPKLDLLTYAPRGNTPLIDAAYNTIEATANYVASRDDKPQVVVCIQTDGYENCSREHTWEQLNDLIKAKTELGWQFNFMGASIDAYAMGAKMGVAAINTMTYDSASPAKTERAFFASAMNTASYAKGMSASTAYNMGQRAAAGDKYVPDSLKQAQAKPKPIVDKIKL